jgi:hypothetical protein
MKPNNKTCTKCLLTKDLSEYGGSIKGKYSLLSRCKTCENIRQQKWKSANKDRLNARAREDYHRKAKDNPELFYRNKRAKAIKASYGITLEEYQNKLKLQEHTCAICNDKFDINKGKYAFSLDHDHATGKIRDFLCSSCNLALGGFRDDIKILKSAIMYLEGHTDEA